MAVYTSLLELRLVGIGCSPKQAYCKVSFVLFIEACSQETNLRLAIMVLLLLDCLCLVLSVYHIFFASAFNREKGFL